jgi:hypothetical protein
MRRSLLGLAAALAWPAGGAMACTDGSGETHVLLLRPPAILPRAAVVLEVDVAVGERKARRLGSGPLAVAVLRTMRGDLDERSVTLAYDLSSSCDHFTQDGPPPDVPELTRVQGYVVGTVERGPDGRPARDARGRVIVRVILYRDYQNRTPEEERRTASEYDEPPPPAEAPPDEAGAVANIADAPPDLLVLAAPNKAAK